MEKKYRVAHFVRKSSQLKASFIKNQIAKHVNFEPFIVYRKLVSKENDGGFAEFELSNYNYLNLSFNETELEKLLYKTTRSLSSRQIKILTQYLKENNIDILHFHYGTDCGIFHPLLNKIEIPSIVSFYGYDSSSFPKLYFNLGKMFLKGRVFKPVSKVVAMSPDMKNDLLDAGCDQAKIVTHYYGTDCKKFYYKRIYADKSEVIILILASLVPQKGHMFLLRSIKKLIDKEIKNFKLRIVGVGELENELKQYVEENNMQNWIQFVGVIKYASDEMLSEYHTADIFVHPSVIADNGDKEGIPGTIVEAMASGLPVISTYHAGIPYIIENNGTGLLVDEYNYEQLTIAIENLILSRELREKIGLAGQKYAMENLDLDTKELKLEEIYKALVK